MWYTQLVEGGVRLHIYVCSALLFFAVSLLPNAVSDRHKIQLPFDNSRVQQLFIFI
jgi:hypothetical protein